MTEMGLRQKHYASVAVQTNCISYEKRERIHYQNVYTDAKIVRYESLHYAWNEMSCMSYIWRALFQNSIYPFSKTFKNDMLLLWFSVTISKMILLLFEFAKDKSDNSNLIAIVPMLP